MRKFLRQIIRVHVPIRRNQNLLFSVLDECQKARPFVAHPDGREIFRPGAKYDHNFGAVEGGKDVRLIFCPKLVFQRDARKEDLEALLRQLVIEIVCQHRIHGAFAVVVSFFIADKHIKRFFTLGDRQIALLNGFDCFSLGNIDRFLLVISIPERGQIVRILQDRAESHTVDRWHTLMACWILNIFDSVATQNERPVCFRVVRRKRDDLLVNSRRLIKVVPPAQQLRTLVEPGDTLTVQPRQRLPRPTVLANCDGLLRINLHRPAAHFASQNRHENTLSSLIVTLQTSAAPPVRRSGAEACFPAFLRPLHHRYRPRGRAGAARRTTPLPRQPFLHRRPGHNKPALL